MKKIFREAHKMTREMVEKYGVDYQVQFGLNLAYLLEKEGEKEMVEVKEMLKNEELTEEQVNKASEKITNLNKINVEKAEKLCKNDKDIRNRMKNAGLYTFEYGLERNFLGEGKLETKNLKLWSKYGKTRIYYDIYIDGIFAENMYTTVK
jgi:hypothetical protein